MGGDVGRARAAADEALLDDVRAMLREVDPVPSHVTSAARDLLAWRSVDVVLAEWLVPPPPARP